MPTPRRLAAAALVALSLALPGRAEQGISLDPHAWRVDTLNSGASFAVRHMLVSTVRGKLGPVSGTVSYDPANVASIRADVVVDVRKLSTGNDTRDNHLRTPDFFAVDQYPNLTFKSKRVAAGAAGQFQLIGDLTLRGVTKEVTLDVEGPSEILKTPREQRVAATANVTLKRLEYGLKWNQLIETGGAVVSDDVKVTIDLQATRPNTGAPNSVSAASGTRP